MNGETFTAKEYQFCYEYCIDFNATQAAIRAGYSPKTARQISSTLLSKVNIQTRIQHLKDNLAENCGISASMVILEHKKIAFSDACKLRSGWIELKEFNDLTESEKACIQEIQTKEVKKCIDKIESTEVWVKIKLYDKQKSLDSISNILGFNAAIRNELTGKNGEPLQFGIKELTNEEAIKRLKELKAEI